MKNLLGKIVGLKVVVVGDIMLDHYVIGNATRISPEAPVPVVTVETDKYALGAAANVALNVAQLGCKTEVIGKIGSDSAGEMLRSLFREHSIDFSQDWVRDDISTITKTRVVVNGQQLCRIDREKDKRCRAMIEEGLLRTIIEKIENCDALILSDYAKGTLTNANITAFINAARSRNIFVALDPKPSNRLNFSDVSLLTPNKNEAFQMAGVDPYSHDEYQLKEICRAILKKYSPKNLVVTLGPSGMLICDENKNISQIPTYAKEVFDVSGAGDTSIACLTLALAIGEPLIRSAKFANVAAGIVVSKHGTTAISADELLSCENGPTF
jgi:D-beta-D-heptose 7-phosphate kinase/D-beta-D-heptose 1-phosphate adenosyltransferase